MVVDTTSVVLNANEMTYEQLLALAERKKAEQEKILAEKRPEMLKEIADFAMKKFGFTLEAIGLVEKTERKMPGESFYKNPQTGEVYLYKGFGMIAKDVQAWLVDGNNKRKEQYRCN